MDNEVEVFIKRVAVEVEALVVVEVAQEDREEG